MVLQSKKANMRYFLILIALVLCSCEEERGQFAADQKARHEAVSQNLGEVGTKLTDLKKTLIGRSEDTTIIDQILSPLTNAMKLNAQGESSLSAIAEVKQQTIDTTPPSHTADQLKDHPEIDAPPAPYAGISWMKVVGVATSIGLGTLLVLNKVGPLLPYVGPAFEAFKPLQPIVDGLWKLASHSSSVKADQASTVVSNAASQILPILNAAATTGGIPPGPHLDNIQTALQTLASK